MSTSLAGRMRLAANDPKRKEEGLFFESPPGEYDTIHLPENAPRIEIIVPRESDRIQGRTLRVSVNSEGIVGKIKQIDFFIDDILVGSRAIKPYDIYLTIPASLDFETAHVLRVRAYDEYGNAGMEERTFYILDR